MKKKLNINWTIVAIILTIIGVGYFISLVHEVNEKDREREYNIHHYSTGKSSSGSYSTGGSSSGTSSCGNSRHPAVVDIREQFVWEQYIWEQLIL